MLGNPTESFLVIVFFMLLVYMLLVSFLLKPYKASFSENEPTFVSLIFHYCKKEE